jgi:hypothetical protein
MSKIRFTKIPDVKYSSKSKAEIKASRKIAIFIESIIHPIGSFAINGFHVTQQKKGNELDNPKSSGSKNILLLSPHAAAFHSRFM